MLWSHLAVNYLGCCKEEAHSPSRVPEGLDYYRVADENLSKVSARPLRVSSGNWRDNRTQTLSNGHGFLIVIQVIKLVSERDQDADKISEMIRYQFVHEPFDQRSGPAEDIMGIRPLAGGGQCPGIRAQRGRISKIAISRAIFNELFSCPDS